MQIAVVGAGGMGSAFAAFLAEAGEEVLLVGRNPEHARAVSGSGLRVDRPDGSSSTVRVPATADPASLPAGSIDAIVLLTKTYDSAQAVGAMAHTLRADGFAVSLQNGLGNERPLAACFGTARALIGVTTVGAHLHAPGHITITHTTAAGTSVTQLGPPRGTAVDMAGPVDLAARLSRAGLGTVANPEVEIDIWAKLALAVMGPASAALRRPVGRVWGTEEGRLLIRTMFDEVVAVAHAEGVPLDADAAWQHSVRTFEGTGDHFTSMATDVIRHRPTEIESMAGEVARRGARHRVPTPVHDTICSLIRVAQATYAHDPEGR